MCAAIARADLVDYLFSRYFVSWFSMFFFSLFLFVSTHAVVSLAGARYVIDCLFWVVKIFCVTYFSSNNVAKLPIKSCRLQIN